MGVAASDVFAFLDSQETSTIIRYEIEHPALHSLRVSVRHIVIGLGEALDQESDDISNQLRALVSEWLTVPLPFDRSMSDALTDLLRSPLSVETRWGGDIRGHYEEALRATRILAQIENPLREQLREAIEHLRSNGQTFKIYCHRRARSHFSSLFSTAGEPPIPDESFLHSVRDYGDTKPFDDLIKVGPLRARGWSSAPDALITAPRFHTLLQFVWTGCRDEPDFGYDPVELRRDSPKFNDVASGEGAGDRLGWTTVVRRVGEGIEPESRAAAVTEETWVFKEASRLQERRSAMLIQVDDEHGILFPRHSRILSFNPKQGAHEPLARRVLGENLAEGMYLVLPLTDDVDLGGVRAEHGSYSQVWRARLDEQWRTDDEGLVGRLHSAGLALVHTKSAIRNWLKPPGTVIHAPQRLSHFKILMRVLGLEGETEDAKVKTTPPFWQLAWQEIRRSRGEAIQAGVLEQEIVDDQLFEILRDLLPDARKGCASNGGFRLSIPPRYGITGYFTFLRVCAIEDGFQAPEADLRSVRDLRMIDQWRD